MTDAQIHSILVSVQTLLVAIGGILAAQGLASSGIYQVVMLGASTIMIVGPAVWAVYDAVQKARRASLVTAVAVQAVAVRQAPLDAVIGVAEQKAIIAGAKAVVRGATEKEVTADLNRSQLGGKP